MRKWVLYMLFFSFSFCLIGKSMEIPLRIQAALFYKIISHDPSLKDKEHVRLLIVYDNSTRKLKDECLIVFKKASFEVGSTTPNKLAETLGDYDVVYFMPNLTSLASVCRENKKLSVAGVSKSTEKGEITIGLGLVQDLPRVYINLTTLEKEGHDLSPNILQIAKVYK